MERSIIDVRHSHSSRDGDGVAIERLSLMGEPSTDPVLLIDELKSEFREDFAGGFPPHPHRGMQTLTYLKDGGIIHEDSMGNRGEIRGGGAQWMSAGSGVIHSEMPTLDSHGLHGFQLWFNLPARDKMQPPRYRDIPAAQLARLEVGGVVAYAVAGAWQLDGAEVIGPLTELVPQARLLDLNLGTNMDVEVSFEQGQTAMAYVYDGTLRHGSGVVTAGSLAIASDGEVWRLQAGGAGGRLLLIAGQPIGEPVVGYGPFVMNTRDEINTAMREYQNGDFIKHPVAAETPETR